MPKVSNEPGVQKTQKSINMKKVILSALIVSMAFAVKAQEIPERKTDRPAMHEGKKGHRPGGMDMQKLNLTTEQKEQFKKQREEFKTKMEELKKNDGITVKESREKMATLRKENMEKTNKILTADQKAQLEKMKADGKVKQEQMAKDRGAKMKAELGLSDEQSAKLQKNRTEMADKMKAIRENKSLTEENKRAQMKELMKGQKDQLKSILTEEQLKKMKESQHRGHGEKGKRKAPAADKNTTI